MRFVVDAQLPQALARRLEARRRLALLARVEGELPAIVAALERGETIIEVV